MNLDERIVSSSALAGRLNLDVQACAVCGYPTVGKDDFDSCRICHWMYERVQFHEMYVAPFDVSIEAARINFARYLTFVGPDDGKRAIYLVGKEVIDEKRLVVGQLDALLELGDDATAEDFQRISEMVRVMDKRGRAIAREIIPKLIASRQN